jgi:Fic family protein
MSSFQRPSTLDPVPGDIVTALRRADRAAGAESSYVDQLPQLLDALRDRARVESITASNAIEGVVVENSRVAKLVTVGADQFRNRNEAEFAGYRAALDYLNQEDPGEVTVGLILHLHRLLFSFTQAGGGEFKTADNLVVDRDADGARTVRFAPVSARETPFYVDELVARSREATAHDHHPLIVTAAFALDLLCIHPFTDGNGRVARLLTAHLLQRAGYRVGRYVSLEHLIYESKDEYYAALAASTDGWFDDAQHDLWPWARYLIARLDSAYDQFESRIAASRSGSTKQERVRNFVLLHAPATFAIADIRRALPGVSDHTIRLVLSMLREESRITNDGVGRSALWHRT